MSLEPLVVWEHSPSHTLSWKHWRVRLNEIVIIRGIKPNLLWVWIWIMLDREIPHNFHEHGRAFKFAYLSLNYTISLLLNGISFRDLSARNCWLKFKIRRILVVLNLLGSWLWLKIKLIQLEGLIIIVIRNSQHIQYQSIARNHLQERKTLEVVQVLRLLPIINDNDKWNNRKIKPV